MTQIIVLPHVELCPDGAVIDVAPGTSICDALLENGIEIEHACEKSCACTTCHVIVREGFDSLPPSSEDEDDLLHQARAPHRLEVCGLDRPVADEHQEAGQRRHGDGPHGISEHQDHHGHHDRRDPGPAAPRAA